MKLDESSNILHGITRIVDILRHPVTVGGSVVKARREIGQINDEWRFVNRRLVEYAWADSLLPNQMTTFTGKIESIITNPEWRASRERLAELRPIARITLK